MVFAMDDATIKKYKLGEFFGLNDPITGKPTLRNPYYTPEDGVFPLPGLAGIKGLQQNGTKFFVCDMARKVYAQFVGQKAGVDPDTVYKDFVKGTLPGIEAAPSGVWVDDWQATGSPISMPAWDKDLFCSGVLHYPV